MIISLSSWTCLAQICDPLKSFDPTYYVECWFTWCWSFSSFFICFVNLSAQKFFLSLSCSHWIYLCIVHLQFLLDHLHFIFLFFFSGPFSYNFNLYLSLLCMISFYSLWCVVLYAINISNILLSILSFPSKLAICSVLFKVFINTFISPFACECSSVILWWWKSSSQTNSANSLAWNDDLLPVFFLGIHMSKIFPSS